MHRTEGSNFDEVDGKKQFKDGPPGTTLEQAWLNAVQEEIAVVIEAAGITLKTASTETKNQLLLALQNGSFAADVQETLTNKILTGNIAANIRPSTGKVLVLPDVNDTLIGKATTDVLTNKLIDGSLNTINRVDSVRISGGGSWALTKADIGGWDMNLNAANNVTLLASTVIIIGVTINPDDASYTTRALSESGHHVQNGTLVTLTRDTSGVFHNTTHNNFLINRGYITYLYQP